MFKGYEDELIIIEYFHILIENHKLKSFVLPIEFIINYLDSLIDSLQLISFNPLFKVFEVEIIWSTEFLLPVEIVAKQLLSMLFLKYSVDDVATE